MTRKPLRVVTTRKESGENGTKTLTPKTPAPTPKVKNPTVRKVVTTKNPPAKRVETTKNPPAKKVAKKNQPRMVRSQPRMVPRPTEPTTSQPPKLSPKREERDLPRVEKKKKVTTKRS